MNTLLTENRARPGLSTMVVGIAALLAVAPYVMFFVAWHVDQVAFLGPAIMCFLAGGLLGLAGVVLSIRRVSLVPDWQWHAELTVALLSLVLLLNLLRLAS